MQVDIVIPVYNAYEDLQICLESVFKYTNLSENRLILINDNSTDYRIRVLLDKVRKENHDKKIVVLHNENNMGFSHNVNLGMAQSKKDDVLLLNSDTRVTRGWIEKITACAYSSGKIGTVTPLSNNATLCSVPNFCEENMLPPNMDVDQVADAVERCSLKKYPKITVANGFCMYIKREVIARIGYFDAETFGRGYGEENDFCNRAEQAGYIHVMCDDTYIYHKGTKSFTSKEKNTYIKEHERILYQRYPRQMRNNIKFCKDNPNEWVGWNIAYHLELYSREIKEKNGREFMEKQVILSKKTAAIVVLVYFVVAAVFYYAAYDRICFTEYRSAVEEYDGYLAELSDGTVVMQKLQFDVGYVYEIGISVATFMRINTGNIIIQLEDSQGDIIAYKKIKAESVQDNSIEKLSVKKSVDKDFYTLKIISDGGAEQASITVYRNSGVNYLGHGYWVNGVECEGTLQLSLYGGADRPLGRYYWPVTAVIGAVLYIIFLWSADIARSGRTNSLIKFFDSANKYKFLIRQLVDRDFKTKYKRSVLGVCWSLLNPLLMMTVQYIVFSTIFRSDIENFPLYLLCGSVLFTFFTDSVGAGLMSIVGNASLITKVYVPKYIYPISKVFSTAINLLLSMIPLFIVVLVTKAPITKVYLLIPFVVVCLVVFCIGMSFLLSSAMVFFRDTQFLWGVVTILWMYATPLFYPETIIPDHFRFILVWNPMYHYVSFLRMIMQKGMSPYLSEYVYCAGLSLFVLACGIYVYKKTENKFILFI